MIAVEVKVLLMILEVLGMMLIFWIPIHFQPLGAVQPIIMRNGR